ncbi:16S rRNA (guanine(966)-N(2))-methyltransferase RsmD [Aeromicrobium sp. CTD01-1L150]|uniref:16S rRNA (guanine(966)-N(2))-methyltransferase RsmD n=1 Tax=Aeromicrobium sp. CTD01-1L150 TaxID=3341830 RepID=UPI0035C07C5B
MRIIAGQWGGRRLRTPSGEGTRPTSDRVRESLFSSLDSLLGGFEGVRVLDLFAGSGALGLEALSRGAESADLVESNGRAASVAAGNTRDLGAAATVHRATAQRFVADHGGPPWHLVLIDPPYALPADDVTDLLTALVPHLDPDAVVVVERSSRDSLTWPEGLEAVRDKAYGETTLWYGRPVAGHQPSLQSRSTP